MRGNMAKERTLVATRKYHYTYLIRDHKNNKVYYGVHSTDNNPWSIENYHSSSKHLKIIIKREGFKYFTKEVRRFFNTRREANLWEYKVLCRINAKDHEDFYNKSNGGELFSVAGKVTVTCFETGENLSVPVDDTYIGVLYDYVGKGRPCPSEVKKSLSKLVISSLN